MINVYPTAVEAFMTGRARGGGEAESRPTASQAGEGTLPRPAAKIANPAPSQREGEGGSFPIALAARARVLAAGCYFSH